MRLPQARLDQVLDRFREIEARMGAAADGAEIVRLSKEHAELKPVADAVATLERARAEAPELEEMAASGDAEMAELARAELHELSERLPGLERDVALLLAPKDRDENASAILEVRAGTGGDEAALFAGDLFRMYQRYAATRGWRVEIDSISEGDPRPGPSDRHLSLVRRRRTARQQDRLGGAHHPPANRHRGDQLGEVAAPEPRPRHEGA
jgi:peptide chain release factor 1